jgi:hypothetical protein
MRAAVPLRPPVSVSIGPKMESIAPNQISTTARTSMAESNRPKPTRTDGVEALER